nr:unnamed protein product [Digitaria exilis]
MAQPSSGFLPNSRVVFRPIGHPHGSTRTCFPQRDGHVIIPDGTARPRPWRLNFSYALRLHKASPLRFFFHSTPPVEIPPLSSRISILYSTRMLQSSAGTPPVE